MGSYISIQYPSLNRVIHAAMTDSNKSYMIYMAVRLLEMHRILKSTGSIYLHCDPTMSHYLKLAMDAIFERGANSLMKLFGLIKVRGFNQKKIPKKARHNSVLQQVSRYNI